MKRNGQPLSKGVNIGIPQGCKELQFLDSKLYELEIIKENKGLIYYSSSGTKLFDDDMSILQNDQVIYYEDKCKFTR